VHGWRRLTATCREGYDPIGASGSRFSVAGTIPPVRWLVVVSVLALLLGGCGDDEDDRAATPEEVAAQVYASVVAWFADDMPPPEEGELVAVYLDGLDDDVPIEVQVEVLDVLDDEVDVRFIDDDEEAVDEELDGAPVRKEGLLLRLGPIVERDGRREVDVERYEGEGEASRYRFVLESSGDEWRVVGEPEELPVPDPEG
jgi:hypothetical protein